MRQWPPGPLPRRVRRRVGIGDMVAYVAQPIAGVLDRVLGTRIRHCRGCARRKRALNRLFRRWT